MIRSGDHEDQFDLPLPPRRKRRRDGGADESVGESDERDGVAEGGAIVPYAGDGAGAVSLLASMPARPVAITKYGYRQFVETDQGVRLFLQNCVASCDLRCAPDLAKIATHARNAEFNPQRFAAVILRLREPKATALIFASGKMVVTGTKNEEDALLAARTVAKILIKLGFACSVAGFKIQNIVATGDCGFPIRLEGLADEHSKFSSYEPELFPGLIYRMEQPRIVLLVFVSGKVVITGAKTRSTVIEGLTKLYPLIFKYRKAAAAVAAGAL